MQRGKGEGKIKYMQNATLLRVHKGDKYAVMLHSTRAVVCVHWVCPDPAQARSLACTSYTDEVQVLVALGEYNIDKGVFEGVLEVLSSKPKAISGTKYQRVPLSSL